MKLKAQQRIKEGRPQPVDPLAVNLFLMPEFDASISAPHAIFIGLTLSEVEDVCEEILTWQARIDHRLPVCPRDQRGIRELNEWHVLPAPCDQQTLPAQASVPLL